MSTLWFQSFKWKREKRKEQQTYLNKIHTWIDIQFVEIHKMPTHMWTMPIWSKKRRRTHRMRSNSCCIDEFDQQLDISSESCPPFLFHYPRKGLPNISINQHWIKLMLGAKLLMATYTPVGSVSKERNSFTTRFNSFISWEFYVEIELIAISSGSEHNSKTKFRRQKKY